ncbi:MAG: hypothetical protein JNM62_04380 [Flavobacteriales bacterium]|nr:hypothetical protein [Flavobacteriales bacterium]
MRHTLTLLLIACQFHGLAQTIMLEVLDETCGSGHGSITALWDGGSSPYDVLWSNGATSVGDTSMSVITGLHAGTYSVTVTDALGIVQTATADLENHPGLQLDWAASTSYPTCDDACRTLFFPLPADGSAGGPFTVTTVPAADVTMGPWFGISELCGGTTYTATITDVAGCSASWSMVMEDLQSPELLAQTLTGSCNGDATGSASFQFDQSVTLHIYPPGGTISYPGAGLVNIDGLPPGDHFGYAFPVANSTCYDSLSFVIPTLGADCGTISGTLFADLDGDCAQDADEPGLAHRTLTIEPGGIAVLTDATGNYFRGLVSGSYTIDHNSAEFLPNCPGTLPAPFTLDNAVPNALQDLALSPVGGPDASSTMGASTHCPGQQAGYWVTVTNQGPYTMTDLDLQVQFDPLLDLLYPDSIPATIAPGLLTWNIPTLPPFASWNYFFLVQVPADPGLLGTVLSATSTVSGVVPDADPLNDSYTQNAILIGPYDPNDKIALTSSATSTTEYLIEDDVHVDYTIRFQNTGTAAAQDVYLLDTLDSEWDMSTFRLLAASHSVDVQLLDERVLRFNFPGIQLPDSNANEAGSHGFVRFRISPATPMVGDRLTNAADIYFDFNPTIRTNTSVLLVETGANVSENKPLGALLPYPNPADDVLQVNVPCRGMVRIAVLASDGRLLAEHGGAGPTVGISTAALAPGTYLLRATDESGVLRHGVFQKH